MGWTGDACNTGTIVFTLSYKTKYLFKVDNQIIQRKQKKLKEDLKNPFHLCLLIYIFILGPSLTYSISVTSTLSSTYMTCLASRATDGNLLRKNTSDDTLLCGACSITSGTEPPWLQLDLGQKFLINYIKVYGRGNVNILS